MKLQQYLKNEQFTKFTDEEIAKILKRDCKPFLKEKTIFWRGGEGKTSDIEIFSPRQTRKPKDMPLKLQKILDDCFNKKFGWKPRSTGVFAVRDYWLSADYGEPYMFFPIGKFRFLYSMEVDDLYNKLSGKGETTNVISTFRNYGNKRFAEHLFVKEVLKQEDFSFLFDFPTDVFEKWLEKEYITKYLPEWLDKFILDGYIEKNLSGTPKEHEVMFKCKTFYLVNEEFNTKDFKKILGIK